MRRVLVVLSALLDMLPASLLPVFVATTRGSLGAIATVLLFVATKLFAAALAIGWITWAWSIPFVLGGCAAFTPDRRDAVWLSFAAKAGQPAGPALAGLLAADRPRVRSREPAVVRVGHHRNRAFMRFQRHPHGAG